ncbi:MAG: hypothetical protein IK097_02510 [Clostridia bacterium]|nr:hypothetical protein [Clostridia bacterium]
MKKRKIIKAFICILLTLAVTLPGGAAYAASENRIYCCPAPEDGKYLSIKEPDGMDADADWERVYNLLFNAVYNDTVQSEDSEITVDISSCNIPFTTANLEYLSGIVFRTPKFFAVRHSSFYYSYGYYSNMFTKLYFTGNPAANKAKYIECEDAAEQLLYGIKGNDALSAVDKCLLLHDRLDAYCEYDYINYENNTIPDESYDAYGAFAKRTAVCNGYAFAYMWLLDEIGIENYLISSSQISHAFTKVIIDSEPYYIDTTWDDPVWDVPGRVKHGNFMLSYATFSENHRGATDFDDDATSTIYEDYFPADSETQVLYIGGDFYYLKESDSDSSKFVIIKRDMTGNESECLLIDKYYREYYSSNSYSNYKTAPKILNIGDEIIYTAAKEVRSYNILTKEDKLIYTPTSALFPGTNYLLFGLKQIDGRIFVTSNYSSAFNSATVSDYTESFIYCNHSEKEILKQTEGDCKTLIDKTEICRDCRAVIHSSGYGNHIPGSSAQENTVPSTCTESGHYDNVVRCSVCNTVMSRNTVTTGPLGHNLIHHEGVNSTCKTQGYKPYDTCSRCTYTTYESLPLSDHTPGTPARENIIPSTCTESGHYDRVVRCSVCRNILSSERITTEPTGHTYSVSVTPPTCTEKGYTTHTCHCGDSYVDSYKEPLGHSFTNYKYNNDATPEKDGTETAKCDRCTATHTRTKQGTIITNPTYASKINVRSSANVSYRADVTVTATAENVPSGFYLAIYDGNEELARGTNTNVSYHVGEMRSTRTFTVKIIDAEKNVQTDLSNNLLQKTVQVNVNSGFFARIVAWFRSLFGSLPKEVI